MLPLICLLSMCGLGILLCIKYVIGDGGKRSTRGIVALPMCCVIGWLALIILMGIKPAWLGSVRSDFPVCFRTSTGDTLCAIAHEDPE